MSEKTQDCGKAPATEVRKIGNAKMASYQLGDDPYVLRFVKTGHTKKRMYHVIREDAFDIWPWTHQDGTPITIAECVMTWEQVKSKFNIELEI